MVFLLKNFTFMLFFGQVYTVKICVFFVAATSMKWVEVKMKELGVTSNPNYKICFMLDSLAMISVHTPKYGVIEVRRTDRANH